MMIGWLIVYRNIFIIPALSSIKTDEFHIDSNEPDDWDQDLEEEVMRMNEEALKLRIIHHVSEPKITKTLWSPKTDDFSPDFYVRYN